MKNVEKKVGLVLSGGGARGIAHLGMLKALEEFGIKPDIISGASAGSMVGAFYAAGYAPEEIISIVRDNGFFGMSNISFRKLGIFDMKNFHKIFLKYFPENHFSALQIPLHVATTDIVQGESVYFSEGELAMPLMASSCVPVVFQPVRHNSYLLVDGGVLNNFPIEPLQDKCDILIGSHVNSIGKDTQQIGMKDMMDRSFHLALNVAIKDKFSSCDVFIEPPNMSRFNMFNTKMADAIFEAGYAFTLSKKEELLAVKEKIQGKELV